MKIPSDSSASWLDIDLGKAHALQGDYACAILAFTAVIQSADREIRCPMTGNDPPYYVYCEALYHRGLTYRLTSKDDQALKDFGAIIEKSQTPVVAKLVKRFLFEIYLQRGILYAERGEPRQAIDDFTQVIRIKKRHAEAYYRRALAYKEVFESERAETDLETATRLDPFGFCELREQFSRLPSSKACVTFPDTRFGKTVEFQPPWVKD